MTALKVGDELAFKQRYGSLQIRVIDRMTPSDRIVCGDLTLNYDTDTFGNRYLTIRGPAKRDFEFVRIASNSDRQQIQEEAEKRELIRGIKVGLADMRLLANSQLQRILDIIHQ